MWIALQPHPHLGVQAIVPREGQDRKAKNRPRDFCMEASGSKKAPSAPFFPRKQAEGSAGDL